MRGVRGCFVALVLLFVTLALAGAGWTWFDRYVAEPECPCATAAGVLAGVP